MAGQNSPAPRVPAYMIDAKTGKIDWNATPSRPAGRKAPSPAAAAPARAVAPSAGYLTPQDDAPQSYADYDRQEAAKAEGGGKQFLRGLMQGQMLGWSDEILPATNLVKPGYRERYAEGAEDHPILSGTGETLGALSSVVNKPLGVSLWKGLPTKGVFEPLANPSTRAAVVGGVHGVVAGAGDFAPREVSLEDRAYGAGVGGTMGAVSSALAIPAVTGAWPRGLRMAPAGAMDEALSRDAATFRKAMRPTPDRLERIPYGPPLKANTGGNETKTLIGSATSTRAGGKVMAEDAVKTAKGAVGRTVGALRAVNPRGATPAIKDEMAAAMAKAFFDPDKGIHQDWTARVQGGARGAGKARTTTYAPMNQADRARVAERIAVDIQAKIEADPAAAEKILDRLQTPMMQARLKTLIGSGKFRTPPGSSAEARTKRGRIVEDANEAFAREPKPDMQKWPLTKQSAERLARESLKPRGYLYVERSDRVDPITRPTLRPGFMASDYQGFGGSLKYDSNGKPMVRSDPNYWIADGAAIPAGHWGPAIVDAVQDRDGTYRVPERGGYLR